MATVSNKLATEAQATTLRLHEFFQSEEFKVAFKIALAMVITYAVALSMGWNNPHWAGFSVAFCALATGGESLHKGLLRIAGTFVAFFVTLALIALFPQDRWLFFGALSLYLAFCNYMMGGTSRWYFWNIAAAGVPMLAFSGGPEAVNAFDIVVLRAQMTVLGIVVYSLVSALLWPSSTGDVLGEAVKKLASAQHQLFLGYRTQLSNQAVDGDMEALRNQVIRGAGGLEDLLNGAELDSLDIWEVRHVWRQCIGQFSELNTRLDRWRHAFAALRDIDVERMAPAFFSYTADIDTRFGQIEQMLAGAPPTVQQREISLQLDREQASQLSHFHRAAIILAMNQLQEIDRVTRALFNYISIIRGFAAAQESLLRRKRPTLSGAFDPDRIASVLRMLSSLWLALLIWIYLPDVPAYSAFMAMVCAIALMFMIMPQVPATTLAQPIFLSIAFAAVMHILIMPQLDGFAGLAVMIFTVTFAISYLFAQPQQMISRVAGLIMFYMLTSIDTPQVYSFLKIANIAMVIVLVLGVLSLTTYFPISFRPEKRFLRMLVRFFRSGEYLIAAVPSPATPSWIDSWRRTFHLHEVTTIPRKLAPWARALPPDALGKSSRAQLQAALTSLEMLGWHIQELTAARKQIGWIELPQELNNDLQTWRTRVETLFARLSAEPGAADHATLRKGLDDLLERINKGIEEMFNSTYSQSLTPEDENNAYQLLGSFRGLSEALLGYARTSADIDWPRLAESRF